MPTEWLENQRTEQQKRVVYGVYMMCEIDKILGNRNDTRRNVQTEQVNVMSGDSR